MRRPAPYRRSSPSRCQKLSALFLSLTPAAAAEVARLRRKLNSSSGGLIGPGEGLHMQRSSDAQGTRYVREQSSGWAHPISAKHTSAAANISSTRRMCTDLSRELPFRWKAKRMPSTRNAEPRTPCTCRQLLLRSPSSHNNIVCAWSHLLQPERAHATTCQMQGTNPQPGSSQWSMSTSDEACLTWPQCPGAARVGD